MTISSPSSAYHKECCKDRPIRIIFSWPFSSLGTHALRYMLNHGNTLVPLLHCVSLSFCQLRSTLPPVAQLLLSQSQQGGLVRNHLQLSNALLRNSQPCCEPLYAINTSHHKQETFLYECPLHWVLLPTKIMHNSKLLAIIRYIFFR
jgi:hypothetical protein